MKSGTWSIEPISVSIRMTASLAPPWRGPYSAAVAAAQAEYGSAWDEATVRNAVVPQFCSWSACRMNKTSNAWARTGSASYRGSAVFHIIDRKFDAKSSELSGYTNGMPTLKRWQAAASVGILAMSRTI